MKFRKKVIKTLEDARPSIRHNLIDSYLKKDCETIEADGIGRLTFLNHTGAAKRLRMRLRRQGKWSL